MIGKVKKLMWTMLDFMSGPYDDKTNTFDMKIKNGLAEVRCSTKCIEIKYSIDTKYDRMREYQELHSVEDAARSLIRHKADIKTIRPIH